MPCLWDDVSQAEAFAHTLQAFFRKFTDMSDKDFYLVGESYFGQYGTNIGTFIFNTEPFRSQFRLKGLGFGNACHGGNETFVMCPGFNVDKNTAEFYWRQNVISSSFYSRLHAVCQFPQSWVGQEVHLSDACQLLLQEMDTIARHKNVFYLRDNCELSEPAGIPSAWRPRRPSQPPSLSQVARKGRSNTGAKKPREVQGGFPYPCFVGSVVESYLTSPQVAAALHVSPRDYQASSFNYTLSGPAAIALYPSLMKQVDILVYNGDADSLAIYPADEEWIAHFASTGVIKETRPWFPWHTDVTATPAGFTTNYSVPGSEKHFVFSTVHDSGHMVPSFTPAAGLGILAQVLREPFPSPSPSTLDLDVTGAANFLSKTRKSFGLQRDAEETSQLQCFEVKRP